MGWRDPYARRLPLRWMHPGHVQVSCSPLPAASPTQRRLPTANGAPARGRHFIVVWALVLFAGCAFLYTRHNAWPYWYHWDEGGKARQIATGELNFHHPLLLLNAVRVRLLGVDTATADLQDLTVAGRTVSALLAAAAVALLAVAAYRCSGRFAAVLAGLLTALSPSLFVAAHAFKEDAALALGFAAFFCASAGYGEIRSRSRALLLGAACGLAVSAKYIGVLTVPVGLVLCLTNLGRREAGLLPPRGRALHGLLLVGAAAVFAALVNVQALESPAAVRQEVAREVDQQRHDATGLSLGRELVEGVEPGAALAALLYLLAPLARRRPGPAYYAHLLLPGLYVSLLAVSLRLAPRYLLPVALFSLFLGALGIAGLRRSASLGNGGLRPGPRTLLAPVLLGAALCTLVPRFVGTFRSFAGPDPRAELVGYIQTALPGRAIVACDVAVHLRDRFDWSRTQLAGRWRDRVVQPERWQKAEGDRALDWLAAAGVTHVAINASYARHFVRWGSREGRGQFAGQGWRPPFYAALEEQGRIVWRSEEGRVTWVAPELRLYEIRPAGP